MTSFNVNYVTTLPKEGNAPRLEIIGNNDKVYNVYYYEIIDNDYRLYCSGICRTNQTYLCQSKQWFTNWFIKVEDENNQTVFTDKFDVKNKIVFIKMDGYALGDNIAWIPYVEEFRKTNQCSVICSTFHNDIFVKSYPNILFVKPNTIIDNVYAQYYVGADKSNNKLYSPINVDYHPLQMVASSQLGFKHREIRPELTPIVKYSKRKITEKYVTLSEFGSTEKKEWKYDNGWQEIVDYINNQGLKVVVISKEKTNLKNVIDLSGNYSLIDRMSDIYHSEFHMGVSSGLSWLAWSLNKKVLMISDVTPNWHEFKTNIIRINSNDLKCVDYEIKNITSPEIVIKQIQNLL